MYLPLRTTSWIKEKIMTYNIVNSNNKNKNEISRELKNTSQIYEKKWNQNWQLPLGNRLLIGEYLWIWVKNELHEINESLVLWILTLKFVRLSE